MAGTCLFCKIAAGEIPSEKVAETDRSFAFLDIKPLAQGHVLVVPKRHADRITDLDPMDAADLFTLARHVLSRQADALKSDGATVAVNDGRAAGQEVMHVHLHLVPRRDGDGIGPIHRLFMGHAPDVRPGDLQEIGRKLRG